MRQPNRHRTLSTLDFMLCVSAFRADLLFTLEFFPVLKLYKKAALNKMRRPNNHSVFALDFVLCAPDFRTGLPFTKCLYVLSCKC